MLGSVKMFRGIWDILMVSELVTGASISQLYVPAYDDYVVGEQSLEWRWNLWTNQRILFCNHYSGMRHRQWQIPMVLTHGTTLTWYLWAKKLNMNTKYFLSRRMLFVTRVNISRLSTSWQRTWSQRLQTRGRSPPPAWRRTSWATSPTPAACCSLLSSGLPDRPSQEDRSVGKGDDYKSNMNLKMSSDMPWAILISILDPATPRGPSTQLTGSTVRWRWRWCSMTEPSRAWQRSNIQIIRMRLSQ